MRSFLTNARELGIAVLRLRRHVRVGYLLVATILAGSIVGAALETAAVGLLIPLLETLRAGQSGPSGGRVIQLVHKWLPSLSPSSYVFALCVLVILLILLKSGFVYASQRGAARLKRIVSVNLRDALYRTLQLADLDVFDQSTAGETANVLMLETARTIYITEYLTLFCQRLSVACAYLVALVLISWQLTIFSAVLALTSGALVVTLFHRQSRSGKLLAELNEQLGIRMLETFGGIHVIRTTNSQVSEIGRFHKLNEENAIVEERSSHTAALLLPMTETAGVIGGMSLIACAHQLLVRPGLMSTEVLLGFAVILLRLLPVVNQLYALHGQMLYLGGAANTVVQWLQLPVFPRQPFGNREFTTVVGSIQFQDLCYTYTTGTIALDRASFSVPAGKTVALVGGSGSGKSTIAALLLRLRQPSGGHILIDGQDYWSYSAECWHRLVAVVEQESFLFHDTIANNIAYGYPNATPEAIRRAVRLAHLEDFIECLPNGLDTIVGERGAMLSGGQRQRIAIARALVRDPKILILDEATSALDSISERQVQAALEEARCGRTVLVIAHRFSTIQWADSIVVLEGGRVVEQGSWEDLHRAEGAFQSLLTASQLSVA